MIKKNDEFIGVITDIGSEGEGILRLENLVVFLPFGLVGEKVRYKILKVSSKFAYGKILEVLTPAENRIRPKCAVFGKCGGCQLQHLRYQSQLKLKEENVQLKRDLETALTNLDDAKLEIIKLQTNYNRLKLAKAYGWDEKSKREANLRISQLVRDIDKCLGLLNSID